MVQGSGVFLCPAGVLGGGGSRGIDAQVDLPRGWQIEVVMFLDHLPGAIEAMFEPEVGGEGMLGRRCDHAILDRVAFFEPQDAHSLYAHVLIRRVLFYGWIRRVGYRARQQFARPAVRVSDKHERNLHLLKGPVVVERNAREFACAQSIVDLDDGVNRLVAVSVDFETDVRLEQPNFKGQLRLLGLRVRHRRVPGFPWSTCRLLRPGCGNPSAHQRYCRCNEFHSPKNGHAKSVEASQSTVKRPVPDWLLSEHGQKTAVRRSYLVLGRV